MCAGATTVPLFLASLSSVELHETALKSLAHSPSSHLSTLLKDNVNFSLG